MQLDGQQQWRDHSCQAKKDFEGCLPGREDLCKEVPPHSNVGGGIWSLPAATGRFITQAALTFTVMSIPQVFMQKLM